MKKPIKSDPVSVGYRIAGSFFALIGLAILTVAWVERDSGWLIILIVLSIGIGLLTAKTGEKAERWTAWLLLGLIIPR